MSLADQYLAWRKGNAVGCAFARAIASNPARYGQFVEIVGGAPATIAHAIDQCVDRFVQEPKAQAVAMVCPEISSAEELVEAALALDQLPVWSVSRWPISGTPVGDVVAFGVVRDIPFGSGACPSEMLALGPFLDFPNTRKAPVTAFEIFVGTPYTCDPKTNAPTTKANLSHVNMRFHTQMAFDRTWSNSITGRSRSLGSSDDDRAKAKVSFAIPLTMATALGCYP